MRGRAFADVSFGQAAMLYSAQRLSRRFGWQPHWQPRDSISTDTGRQPPNTVPGRRLKSTLVDTPRVPTDQLSASSESEFKALSCSVSVRTILAAELKAHKPSISSR
jgi:hypothetical protein